MDANGRVGRTSQLTRSPPHCLSWRLLDCNVPEDRLPTLPCVPVLCMGEIYVGRTTLEDTMTMLNCLHAICLEASLVPTLQLRIYQGIVLRSNFGEFKNALRRMRWLLSRRCAICCSGTKCLFKYGITRTEAPLDKLYGLIFKLDTLRHNS
jgi:hypothetical protein